jgi:hypothetical protein
LPSTIEQVHREYGNQGLSVLAINMGENRDGITAWVKSRSVTSTVLLDPTLSATKSYGIAYTPTVFLVDRSGRLVGKSIGVRAWAGEKGRALLQRLLAR